MITITNEDILSKDQSVIGGSNNVKNAFFSGSTNGWSIDGTLTAELTSGGVILTGADYFYQLTNTTDVVSGTGYMLRVKCSGISGTITAGIGTAKDNVTTASMTLSNGWNELRLVAGNANYVVITGSGANDMITVNEVWLQEQIDLVITGQVRSLGVDGDVNELNVTNDATIGGGITVEANEKVVNGDFTTNITGWTDVSTGSGSIVWNASQFMDLLSVDGSNRGGASSTAIDCVIGQKYIISFEQLTGGSMYANLVETQTFTVGAGYLETSGAGTYQHIVTATATTMYLNILAGTVNFTYQIDDASIKPVSVFDGVVDIGSIVGPLTIGNTDELYFSGNTGTHAYMVVDGSNTVSDLYLGAENDIPVYIRSHGATQITVDDGLVAFTGDVEVGGFIGGGSLGIQTLDTNGSITVTKTVSRVDTFSGAGTDDLEELLGGNIGDFLVLMAADSGRTIVVKDGTPTMSISGDFSLGSSADTMILVKITATVWAEVSRSDNAA